LQNDTAKVHNSPGITESFLPLIVGSRSDSS
jgi:hypothetical protein